MNEDLDALTFLRPPRHELAGVGDEVRPTLERQSLALQPLLETRRSGKHPDPGALHQPVARLGLDDLRVLTEVRLFLADREGRYPELFDLDAAATLVFGRVGQLEERARTADMVAVEVGEGHDVEVVPRRLGQVLAELGRQVA